jgi:HK97 gp10 family phage protein
MGASIRIDGLKELEIRLKRLPQKVAGKALFSALMAGAEVIRKDAVNRAPEDTGKLKRNIVKRREKTRPGLSANVVVGVRAKGKKQDPHNAYYWRYFEFGTSKRPARPFLRPAFETTKVEAVARIAAKLRQRIEQAGG